MLHHNHHHIHHQHHPYGTRQRAPISYTAGEMQYLNWIRSRICTATSPWFLHHKRHHQRSPVSARAANPGCRCLSPGLSRRYTSRCAWYCQSACEGVRLAGRPPSSLASLGIIVSRFSGFGLGWSCQSARFDDVVWIWGNAYTSCGSLMVGNG